MSVEYEFPCECGHINLVTVSDAGKERSCDGCQKPLTVPGMREIKKLNLHEESVLEGESGSKWTYEKGLFFSFGLGALVLGLIIAGVCGYIGYYNFPAQRPSVRGEWKLTTEVDPPKNYPVFAYAPQPMAGAPAYELTIFDHERQLWTFEDPNREPVDKDYFSKWGDSYLASIEGTVHRSNLQDLWKFWYETEPNEPLKEWQEPQYSINGRFANTFYSFAGIGLLIALAGVGMAVYSVAKR